VADAGGDHTPMLCLFAGVDGRELVHKVLAVLEYLGKRIDRNKVKKT
jgi:hypothetical protein